MIAVARKAVLALLLFSTLAVGQIFEGSAGGWILNTSAGDQFFRNYGGVDAAGNYAYRYWSLWTSAGIKTASFIEKPPFRAARIIITNGVSYAQFGDGTCVAFTRGNMFSSACPSAAPPPVVIPPPPPPPPPPTPTPTPVVPGAKPLRIVVVPLHYLSPPSTSPDAVSAYNNSLQYITQDALTATFAPVAAWWTAESYGLQPMIVTVLPEVLLPGNPYCNYWTFQQDAAKAVAAAGLTADVIVGVAPYSCWSSKAVGGWGSVTVWNTIQNGPGMLAHEIGHALYLLHNGSRFGGVYAEYGSGLDQMGAGSDFFTLRHFSSDHKNKLGFLPNPLPCKSATLRSIYTTPDAINCGAWWIDYAPDSGYVYVHKREWGPGQGHGGTDTTDYARLLAGQSYTGGGYTFTHDGNGKVTVKP